MLSIEIVVGGKNSSGKTFVEKTSTITVSAHGALLRLMESVPMGQDLLIRHTLTGEEIACQVVDVGAEHSTGNEIGIAFGKPSPKFWHVGFPPEDWSSRNEEAKQYQVAPRMEKAPK